MWMYLVSIVEGKEPRNRLIDDTIEITIHPLFPSTDSLKAIEHYSSKQKQNIFVKFSLIYYLGFLLFSFNNFFYSLTFPPFFINFQVPTINVRSLLILAFLQEFKYKVIISYICMPYAQIIFSNMQPLFTQRLWELSPNYIKK